VGVWLGVGDIHVLAAQVHYNNISMSNRKKTYYSRLAQNFCLSVQLSVVEANSKYSLLKNELF
jgi:uncharacterized membrane protein YidH (DUF202 family)